MGETISNPNPETSRNVMVGADWPQYRSHKVVRAAEIRRIDPSPIEDTIDLIVRMPMADNRPEIQTVQVGVDVVAGRYTAKPGDFLVRYEPDGYLSVSPRDKFLDGYLPVLAANLLAKGREIAAADQSIKDCYIENTQAPIETAMQARDLEDAVLEIVAKPGMTIQQATTAFLQRQADGFMDFGRALYFLKEGKRVARSGWNGKGMFLFYLPNWNYTDGKQDNYPNLPFIAMKTAGNEVVPWLASQTDMLATDWTVVP
jgi:hypothetical protein